MIRIAALYETANLEEARHTLSELMLAKPDFSRRYVEWLPFTERKWADYFIAALAAVEAGPVSLKRFGSA